MSVPTPTAETSVDENPSLEEASCRMRVEAESPVRVARGSEFEKRPGVLRSESTLTIKTHMAQQMVFGRAAGHRVHGKRAIIGLVGFAGMLKQIVIGSQHDDPYADKWLLDIEAEIDGAVESIALLRETVAKALAQRPDVRHTVAQSVRPLDVPLYFSSQFAFRAAYLINDFDTLVCALQTAKHVAVLTTVESNDMIRHGSKAVRRMFASAHGYQYTGVSRADIVHGTAKGAAVIKRWGELPLDVLNGTRRAEYGPPLPPESFASQIVAHAEVTDSDKSKTTE